VSTAFPSFDSGKRQAVDWLAVAAWDAAGHDQTAPWIDEL